MTNCYSCNGEIRFFQRRGTPDDIIKAGYRPPNGMMNNEILCQECCDELRNTQIPDMISDGKKERLRPDLEFMIIRRIFDETVARKGISNDKYEKVIKTITKKVNPVFKKLNQDQFFNYWLENSEGFDETFYAIKDYLNGSISFDEFRKVTFQIWSILEHEYIQYPISDERNQHDVWVIGYLVVLIKKLFDNYTESEMEQDLKKIRHDLLPTLKDNSDTLKTWQTLVNDIVKKTMKTTRRYFD